MTIRLKLTMLFIAVILVANSLVSLAIVKYIGRVWLGKYSTDAIARHLPRQSFSLLNTSSAGEQQPPNRHEILRLFGRLVSLFNRSQLFGKTHRQPPISDEDAGIKRRSAR